MTDTAPVTGTASSTAPDRAPARPGTRPDAPRDTPSTPVVVIPPATGTLIERMGIELTAVGAERTAGTMPVAGNTQPYGLLHGGASAVLAETLGSVAAQIHAGADRAAVGIELSVSHHRSVRDGVVSGEAVALSLGKSLATYEIAVMDDDGRRVATARLTCMILDARKPADPEA